MLTKVMDKPEIWTIQVVLPDNPLRSLNAYVIKTATKNLLIDTGFNRPECHTALWEGIQALDLDLSCTDVFLTHLHSDHIGLVNEFEAQGCTIYMNGIDHHYISQMRAGEVWSHMDRLFQQEGLPDDVRLRQSTENQARLYAPKESFEAVHISDGTTLKLGDLELVCIHTPGHTPGHTMLYLPKYQVLFTGDHILFDITPNISIWKDVPHSLADYLESLEKLHDLPVQTALPAHRAPQTEISARIDVLKDHHVQRLEEILTVVTQQPGLDAHAIAGLIHWVSREKDWSRFPPHQKWFAMGETLAHLYYLVDAQQVRREADSVGFHYYPK